MRKNDSTLKALLKGYSRAYWNDIKLKLNKGLKLKLRSSENYIKAGGTMSNFTYSLFKRAEPNVAQTAFWWLRTSPLTTKTDTVSTIS